LPPDDHDCGWKAYAESLQAKLEEAEKHSAEVTAKLDAMAELSSKVVAMQAQLDELKRHRFGRKSEKVTSLEARRRTVTSRNIHF
jgi:hypothetical protein